MGPAFLPCLIRCSWGCRPAGWRRGQRGRRGIATSRWCWGLLVALLRRRACCLLLHGCVGLPPSLLRAPLLLLPPLLALLLPRCGATAALIGLMCCGLEPAQPGRDCVGQLRQGYHKLDASRHEASAAVEDRLPSAHGWRSAHAAASAAPRLIRAPAGTWGNIARWLRGALVRCWGWNPSCCVLLPRRPWIDLHSL